MKNYEEKFKYLSQRCKGICPIGVEKYGTVDRVTELHHLLHNTRIHRRKYPLFIDSMLNLMPVAHKNHMAWPSYGKIFDYQAKRYEDFLEKHPKIAKMVNEPEYVC